MKVFMCRQLRVMLNSFERLQVAAQELFPERAAKRQRHNGAGASSDPVTLTPQQLAQVEHFAPALQNRSDI
eukprot:200172-Pleurochrysis_carterae.AAC.1